MQLPSVVGCYRNEIQMLLTLYIDTELVVTLQEHSTLGRLLCRLPGNGCLLIALDYCQRSVKADILYYNLKF